MFIKLFTWSMYKQGCRKPLSFEDIETKIAQDEIPLDDLTYWENKLKKDQLTKIAEIFAIIAGISSIIALILILQLKNNTDWMTKYLELMGRYIEEIHKSTTYIP